MAQSGAKKGGDHGLFFSPTGISALEEGFRAS
jgi:hypothetical protein